MAEAAELLQIAEIPRPLLNGPRRPERRDQKVSHASAKLEPLPAVAAEERISLPVPMWFDVAAYQRDLWERSILFLDALRQRADDLLAHQRAGLPAPP